MKPPMVYHEMTPSNLRISRTTAMVSSVGVFRIRGNADADGGGQQKI